MGNIWIIAKRELQVYFDSLVAYIMLILFLGFSGFFTWIFGNDVFIMGQASLAVFFAIAYWTLFFFTPALTMRLVAEERKSGTLELVMTKSVSNWQFLLGKFTAALLLIGAALVCTLPYVFTVASIGNLDSGEVLGGYLGLVMMSCAYLGIGIYASSLTSNQVVAFLVALLIGLCFHIIFGVLAQNMTGVFGEVFYQLNMATHYESISRGVIDSRDIIYFFSLALAGLVLAESELRKIKING